MIVGTKEQLSLAACNGLCFRVQLPLAVSEGNARKHSMEVIQSLFRCYSDPSKYNNRVSAEFAPSFK